MIAYGMKQPPLLTITTENEVQPEEKGVDAEVANDVFRVPAATAATAALSANVNFGDMMMPHLILPSLMH